MTVMIYSFSGLSLLVGRPEGHLACKEILFHQPKGFLLGGKSGLTRNNIRIIRRLDKNCSITTTTTMMMTNQSTASHSVMFLTSELVAQLLAFLVGCGLRANYLYVCRQLCRLTPASSVVSQLKMVNRLVLRLVGSRQYSFVHRVRTSLATLNVTGGGRASSDTLMQHQPCCVSIKSIQVK